MTRTVIQSRVGPDGVLHLEVPLGAAEANREVQVVVESAARPRMTQEEWCEFIRTTAGSIADPTFRRHEQGEYEEREGFA
ncbi:MAG: hypothetical protein K2R98_30240 [Gemmataceae bacterium]|nr:hypothetical protein [Gemmataceae bacterium]